MSDSCHESAQAPRYEQVQFDGDKPPCDLIMKGGITSGVVYPFAITELATRYRFVSIGGTSAGAIAAGIAAAAEYNRSGGGFLRLAEIPADVSERLSSLFQPRPRYKRAYDTFLAALGEAAASARAARLLTAATLNFWPATLVGLVPGAVLAAHAADSGASWAVWIVALLVLLTGPVLLVAAAMAASLLIGLPRTLFGICPGLRQPGQSRPGLTDWLSEIMERAAGRWGSDDSPPSRPLTFGDLKRNGIDLNVMTTCLGMHRPYRLPSPMARFFWREEDFSQLFPDWVLRHLKAVCPTKALPGCPVAYAFPEPEDLPVIVAVRMSLSFPVLLAAVPLVTRDYTYRLDREEQRKARTCWFSDGGISSNFPIHFFDNLWPSRPTFAITLDAHHPARHGPESDVPARVHMPRKAGGGILVPVREIRGLGAFASAILNSAKDWQDVLQGTLSGYRERIAHVALTEQEGGLNLTMPPERVQRLGHYGYLAGREMLGFDFDEHRWRRYLVALARIEETLHGLAKSYHDAPPGSDTLPYREFLADYAARAQSYSQPPGWIDEALANTDVLMNLAALTAEDPLRLRGRIPKPETQMRISPEV